MGFQIRNKEGQALTMKELDKEAAEFWGKEVDPKWYANPTPPYQDNPELDEMENARARSMHCIREANNWFDAIGWYISEYKGIEYPEDMSWKKVMQAMIGNSLLNRCYNLETLETTAFFDKAQKGDTEEFLMRIFVTIEYYKPYYALIKHWVDKGYTPHRV